MRGFVAVCASSLLVTVFAVVSSGVEVFRVRRVTDRADRALTASRHRWDPTDLSLDVIYRFAI